MAQTILRDAGLSSHGQNEPWAFKDEMTIDQVFHIALKEHWSKKRYVQSGWQREVIRNYENHIAPEFGRCRLSEVTARGIRDWHQGFKESPVAGNRSLEILSRVYSFAQEKEWQTQGQNPCKLVKAFKERKRRRFATEDELKKICVILDREALRRINKKKVAFIYLLMFTGARPRDLERATWDMFKDFGEYGVLTFKGKTSSETGEEEQVFLPPQALRVVKNINRFNNNILGIKLPSRFWKQIIKEAGCPDLWARDLRRTFATIGLSNGVGHGVIGELLNHKSAQTTNIYAKLMDENKVKSVTDIADVISKLTGGK